MENALKIIKILEAICILCFLVIAIAALGPKYLEVHMEKIGLHLVIRDVERCPLLGYVAVGFILISFILTPMILTRYMYPEEY